MPLESHSTFWIFAYIALYGLIAIGIFLWKIKRRGGRHPVKFKLLRGPGETLRRRIAKFDENIPQYLLVFSLGPPFTGLTVFIIAVKFCPQSPWGSFIGLGLGLLIFIVGTALSLRMAMQALKRWRDDQLGYLGEREVAEHLTPLWARGYQIFHDVPAKWDNGKEFNLDHVTVGPTGVTLIEVKTRRKGKARPGFKDHIVMFDGQQLIWPWGEDRYGIDQALHEAQWLQRFIFDRTGIDTPVKAVLALPGWWVESKARGPVSVVNSKNVALAVEGKGPSTLSDKDIDLIARQLDERCRDVED